MPKGKTRDKAPTVNPEKAIRLTFRVDREVIAHFKAIATLKGMKVEEYGSEALKKIINKEKKVLQSWQDDL